eukprot:TRINITY_DN10306_c0_g1_i1.p1 TRINITY_DN10306_c0_g1~~TRINITY_DN10306_c0_g1_i1.p1  ORF type:complete len:141 (-),score=24.29 TRINITY_DN10306_c0_g1_i1:100-522(-)
MSKIGAGAPKCPTCNKTVYANEEVRAIDKAWHKRCLKCAKCAKVLEPGKLNDRDGNVYCNPCYSAVAGMKGYGFGVSSESHVSGGAAGVAPSDTSVVDTKTAGGVTGTATFCSGCGNKLACLSCGSPQKYIYCPSCGTKI